ncbi:hypothetical protein EGY16_16250 [Burkholderia pseudomallei]|nr:hypothetical protein CXQ84_03640 [Burkholderia pseudomallei]AYE28723.1 hypothetical protein CNX72_16245 [Burkholderia pseudomallei]AYX29453.1 hypothetical protein EGY16_16250 [Burkholderia pseudomallei]KAA8767576.1 hypothetical protein F5D26_14485 [Burkholderia pseudomallei]MPT63153.1 hypothetical protein [Burkholderia pseudomallei]
MRSASFTRSRKFRAARPVTRPPSRGFFASGAAAASERPIPVLFRQRPGIARHFSATADSARMATRFPGRAGPWVRLTESHFPCVISARAVFA